VAGRATGPSGRSVLAVSVEGDRGGALGGGLLDAFELHSGGVGAAGADRATGCGRGRDVRDCGRDGVSKPTVITWKHQFAEGGVSALADLPNPGRTRRINETLIMLATMEPLPDWLSVSKWWSRMMASDLRTSDFTVRTTGKKWGCSCHPTSR